MTPAVAAEILNCSTPAIEGLISAKRLIIVGNDGGICLASLRTIAKSLVSLEEINARLGFQERRAASWLRAHGIAQPIQGFASRKEVSAKLGAVIPLGMWRRILMSLTLKQVGRGKADLSNREWDLVRCWIPRRRRSSHGLCDRSVANAIIWITATGRNWKDLPERYGSAEACYARYHHLKRCGAIDKMATVLMRDIQRSRTGQSQPFFV